MTTVNPKYVETEERVVRYVAFENPGKLIVRNEPLYSGGAEHAVFSQRWQNTASPHLNDGVYGEVIWHGGLERWSADVTTIIPDGARRQFVDHKTFSRDDLESAINWLYGACVGEVARVQEYMRQAAECIHNQFGA